MIVYNKINMSRIASSSMKTSRTEETFDDKLVRLDGQYVNLINEYHDYYEQTKDEPPTLTDDINLMIKQFKNIYANDCRENFFNPDEAAPYSEKVVPETYDYFLKNLKIFAKIDAILAQYTKNNEDFCTNFSKNDIFLQLINKHKKILRRFYNNFPKDIQARIALNHYFFSRQAKFFLENIYKSCLEKKTTSGGKSKKRRRRRLRKTRRKY